MSWRCYGVLTRHLRQFFVLPDSRQFCESDDGQINVLGYPIYSVVKMLRSYFSDQLKHFRLSVERKNIHLAGLKHGPRAHTQAPSRNTHRASLQPGPSASEAPAPQPAPQGSSVGPSRPPAQQLRSQGSFCARWPYEETESDADPADGAEQAFIGQVPQPPYHLASL